MNEIMDWINSNKEWLFNGAGGLVLITFLGFIGRYIYKKTSPSSSQKIRSGNNSINIQAGRDAKFSSGSQRDDLEKK